MKYFCLLLFLGISLSWSINIQTSVNSPNIQLGDIFFLDIRVTTTENALVSSSVSFPAETAFTQGTVTFISSADQTIGTIRTKRYWLTSYTLGLIQWPTLFVHINRDYALNLPTVKVNSAFGKEVPVLQDLKRQVSLPIKWWMIGLWIISIFTTGILGWWLINRFKKPIETQTIQRIMIDPRSQALEQIEKLKAKDYLTTHKYNMYYFELTSILKEFLGYQLNKDILECTTQELKGELHNTITPSDYDDLIQFFQRADIVKFAKQIPSSNEVAGITTTAIQFINNLFQPKSVDEPISTENRGLSS